jgi:hypothetical protein
MVVTYIALTVEKEGVVVGMVVERWSSVTTG